MTIQFRDNSSVLRTVKTVTVRDTAKVLHIVKRIYMRDATNTLRLVYDYFTAAAAPTTVMGSGNSPTGITISSGIATVTPTGGTDPLTYAWTKSSGSSNWSAVNPTAATTSFRCTGVIAGDTQVSTWICTVTDGTTSTAVTNVVTAAVTNTNTS